MAMKWILNDCFGEARVLKRVVDFSRLPLQLVNYRIELHDVYAELETPKCLGA